MWVLLFYIYVSKNLHLQKCNGINQVFPNFFLTKYKFFYMKVKVKKCFLLFSPFPCSFIFFLSFFNVFLLFYAHPFMKIFCLFYEEVRNQHLKENISSSKKKCCTFQQSQVETLYILKQLNICVLLQGNVNKTFTFRQLLYHF